MLPITRFRFRSRSKVFGAQFSPASLFAAGEQGAWYDPSDLTTLFEDSAGTIPITTPLEKPVGLMLDKSKGLVLGSELVTNGTFDTNINGWTAQFTSTAVWDNSALKSISSGTNAGEVSQPITCVVGKWYKVTGFVVPGTANGRLSASTLPYGGGAGATSYTSVSATLSFYFLATATTMYVVCGLNSSNAGVYATFDNISVRELAGNHAYQTTGTSRPTLSARYNQLLATATLATQSVTTVSTSYKLSFAGAGSVTLSGTATGTYSAGTNTITCTAGTLTLTVSGSVTTADLRPTNILGQPAYQRVNTATDYDTVGFKPYLKFDGTDDWLTTATITPGTDKAQVFAGVRKLSDASSAILAELSAVIDTNNGAFNIVAPGSAGTNSYRFSSKGTAQAGAGTGVFAPAPITNVLTGIGDISGDVATLRVNGVTLETNTGDQGTGTYGNYPLYIGRRGGTTLPFNGYVYSLVVRFGPNLTGSQISSTETWVNTKTGAY